MENPENTERTIKNGKSREYRKDDRKCRIQRKQQHRVHKTNKRQRIPNGQSKMKNPENVATQGTQDEDTKMLDNTKRAIKHGESREYRKDNQKWRIQRIPKRLSKLENPEKVATQGTQDEDRQKKNRAQNDLDIIMRKQTQIA